MKLIEVKENVYVPDHRILYVTVIPETNHIRFTVLEPTGTLGFSRTFSTEEELKGFFNSIQG